MKCGRRQKEEMTLGDLGFAGHDVVCAGAIHHQLELIVGVSVVVGIPVLTKLIETNSEFIVKEQILIGRLFLTGRRVVIIHLEYFCVFVLHSVSFLWFLYEPKLSVDENSFFTVILEHHFCKKINKNIKICVKIEIFM